MIDPSKDKFAYFKDNIQTAEDKEFDASQYYYHREELSGNKPGAPGAGTATGLSMAAYGMGGGLNDGMAPQGAFSGAFSGGGMLGSATSFLGAPMPRAPPAGGMPSAVHELHRMASTEHLGGAMSKGRAFPLQHESKAPDMSEFPALTRTSSWALDQGADTSSSRSQPSSEFVIQKEDFPALSPFGAPSSNDKLSMQEHTELKRHSSFHSSASDSMATQRPSGPGGNTSIGTRSGAFGFHLHGGDVANANSRASNVSLSGTGAFGPLHGGARPGYAASNGEMDPTNQFGLLGMLHAVIRPSNDAKKNLLMGCDLTSLGLNLNAAEPLHPTFASPWADGPLTKEPQFTLPLCYYNQPPALKTTHLAKFHLETLFYIFFSMPRDVLQAYAAQELYGRDWRYHTDLKLWLKRATPADAALFANGSIGASVSASGPGSANVGTIGSIGSGASSSSSAPALGVHGPQFLYFDTTTWERRVFTGNIHSLSVGLLSEDDIRVKFSAAT